MLLVVLLAILCIAAFRRRETRLGGLRHALVALTIAAYCFSTPVIASALFASLEAPYPPVGALPRQGDPLIVVLSSGLTPQTRSGYEVRLDLAGWERTWAAIRLWRQVGGQLLFVGEPTPDGASSVAAFMAEVARASGVPATAISVETRSRNTHENLEFTRERAAGHDGDVWLVTSAAHLRRALAVAHKLGLHLRPYPCDYRAIPLLHWYAWLPESGGPAMFNDALHEWIGLLYYRMKGYA